MQKLNSSCLKWLIGLLIGLALLTVAFQSSQDDTDSAHCRSCKPPTPTHTPTSTPIPPLQACQVVAVEFDKDEYLTGDPIKITLRVEDADGAPLIGANVDATVSRQPFTDTTEASAIPPLEDQSGTYDGIYTQTDLPGIYTFKFDVSDFTGPRFLPCSAEATVRVEPSLQPCELQVDTVPSGKREYQLNETVNLTANVTVNGASQSGAIVSAQVLTPTGGIEGPFNFIGDHNPYILTYTVTTSGTYAFADLEAHDGEPEQRFLPCSDDSLSITVDDVVIDRPITPTIIIDLPSQPIDLCRRGPDITGTIAISNVTNLTGAQLEVSYDPSFIQVIDAFHRPRPPVQVKPDPNFDPFLRNDVNTRQGKIFFTANAQSPVTGRGNIIYIDWRLQGRTGVTPITVAAVITDASGAQNVTQTKTLQIIINSTCVQGTVNLQGRPDHGGVMVSALSGQQTQSYPSGLFVFPSAAPLKFTFPGYLSAQLDSPDGQTANLERITLLAGDVNGDSAIDILDLAYLAGRYLSTDPSADLNADGIVNILDLALAAGNYQRRGPLTTWQ